MPEWTKEQKRAIETDHRNLLVAAAAGSGKTAVLVERILQKLMRREHPVNVTNLLVVTFTRAAAAEMRERVQKAIVKAVRDLDEWTRDWTNAERQSMRRHLKKQTLLLEQAEISTIDSFCAGIIRNFFHVIDLDPETRLAAENEIKILKSDILKELLEEEYLNKESAIGFLSEYLGTAKTSDHLEATILSLYAFSRNAVNCDEALERYLKPYETETKEELEAEPWLRDYFASLKKRLSGALSAVQDLADLTRKTGGPYYLKELADAELDAIRNAAEASDYDELRSRLGIEFTTLKKMPKGFEGDPEDHERAKALRAVYKNVIASLRTLTRWSEDDILAEFQTARPAAEELVRLTKAFAARFAEEKRKLRVMDFNDQEHFVLNILTKDGAPSEVALSMVDCYDEILIDEYQDSNELQEAILTSFAKRNPETNEPMNIFMVGDIKQSIYRFRQANPEIFNEKYKRYAALTTAPEAEKVELSANFRSRPGVTDAVNFFFEKWMRDDVGGVTYSEEAHLNPKGAFPETELKVGNDTTVLLADPGEKALSADAFALEAHMIAQEILKLLDERDGVYVKADDTHVRKASFKDIVILMRSMGNAELLQDTLERYGIPSYMKRKSGFYYTFEVQFALNYLSIIDNPQDEIALTAVLHSPIFGFSSEDLAKMTAGTKRKTRSTYLATLKKYAGKNDDVLAARLQKFFAELQHFRTLSAEMKLSQLLRTIFRETGLLLFVNALPGGDSRQANLNELVGKAAEFEETSLIGIFNFMRFLDKTREEDDEGEVGTVGENDDLVRIMTIHSSKGLEYPIVFVSNLGKKMNFMDESSTVLMHDRLGIGLKVVRPDIRTVQSKSFFREVIRDSMRREMLGEELRVLYVAMTRAKEKLYLTAAVKNCREKLEKLDETFRNGAETLSYNEVIDAQSYLDWVLAAYRYASPVKMPRPVTMEDLSLVEAEESAEERMSRDALEEELHKSVHPLAAKELREVLGFNYRTDDLSDVYSTMSVSALKRAMTPETEAPARSHVFIKDDRKISGAERGTLYHRVMELIDPEADPEESILGLQKEGLISEAEKGTIDVEEIRGFLRSDVGKRFIQAYRAGRGYRERQFIIGRPAEELFPGKRLPDGELVMIQGVIDLYFEEDDGLVLLDYKTDRLLDEEALVAEYRVQIDLYEKALVMMSGKPVKEKWIYSFALGKGILV